MPRANNLILKHIVVVRRPCTFAWIPAALRLPLLRDWAYGQHVDCSSAQQQGKRSISVLARQTSSGPSGTTRHARCRTIRTLRNTALHEKRTLSWMTSDPPCWGQGGDNPGAWRASKGPDRTHAPERVRNDLTAFPRHEIYMPRSVRVLPQWQRRPPEPLAPIASGGALWLRDEWADHLACHRHGQAQQTRPPRSRSFVQQGLWLTFGDAFGC
jgi:hypothetical protein